MKRIVIVGLLITAMFAGKKVDYAKDVGPYSWQKKGSNKFWNVLGKTFGISGSTVDPAVGIQNFSTVRQRFR